MRLRIPTFDGQHPRISPRLLKETSAQTALNSDMRRGTMKPFKNTLATATPTKGGTAKSIYLYAGSYWFNWTTDVNCVKGPIAGDTSERTYWTGDGAYPKVTNASIATGSADYPSASYRLGIPAPAGIVACALAGTATTTDLTFQETRFYIYTYVSAWGEEGPPSTPSTSINWLPGQTVNLSAFSTAPTGTYNIATKRIYRTNAGTSSAAYQFVAEIAVATVTYNDAIGSANLAEVLPSSTWIAPPDTLAGLIVLPNGVMAGFSANEVCFSEPFQPHAWPDGYKLTADRNIVGIGNYDTTVVVATEGIPYLITGTDPQGMTMQALNLNQGCVSKRSVVSMGDPGVVYASADGLVLIGPNGAVLITEGVITPAQWQAYVPSSITAYQNNGRYFAFYDAGGGVTGGFIFDVRRPEDGLVFLSIFAAGGYSAPKSASVYLIVGGAIVQWDSGSGTMSATWKSKTFVVGQPCNFSFAQVEAASYAALTAKIYADGALKLTQTVTSRDPFRLPSGFLATTWEIEVSGTDEVYEINLAMSGAELAQ